MDYIRSGSSCGSAGREMHVDAWKLGQDYKGLLAQPAEPKFKGALCQIYVRSQPYGGAQSRKKTCHFGWMCVP